MSIALEGGHTDAPLDAQTAFRALMDALANPGTVQEFLPEVSPPAPLSKALAIVALTLCDHDTPLWLDAVLADSEAVVAWLRFHTGAPLTTDPARAQFALVSAASELPALDRFALGTDEYPDCSTTIALELSSLAGGVPLTLRGPGLPGSRTISPQGLPQDFTAQWSANRSLFPRGVDLLLLASTEMIGLPRSTRITEG